jgi:hypothetical protein
MATGSALTIKRF